MINRYVIIPIIIQEWILQKKEHHLTYFPILYSRKEPKTFAFDHCFNSINIKGDYAGQEKVFQCLGRDILDNAFQGYNACIFAYGQTGNLINTVRLRIT